MVINKKPNSQFSREVSAEPNPLNTSQKKPEKSEFDKALDSLNNSPFPKSPQKTPGGPGRALESMGIAAIQNPMIRSDFAKQQGFENRVICPGSKKVAANLRNSQELIPSGVKGNLGVKNEDKVPVPFSSPGSEDMAKKLNQYKNMRIRTHNGSFSVDKDSPMAKSMVIGSAMKKSVNIG